MWDLPTALYPSAPHLIQISCKPTRDIFEHEHHISGDRQLQTANFKPPTSNRQLQTANFKLPTSNCQLQTANSKPPTLNRQLQTANFKPLTSNRKL